MPPQTGQPATPWLDPDVAFARLPDSFRWGDYTRISDDPYDTQRGVVRQSEDIHGAVTKHRGGRVVKSYCDNNKTAYKKRKIKMVDPDGYTYYTMRVIRNDFQQALRDLRAGVIDGLMVYDLDRLARDPRDLEDCIEIVQMHGRKVESYLPGEINLRTDAGITMARVIVAMKNQASADTARRVKRAHAAAAKKGIPVGGIAPFGWRADKKTLHPDNAAILREVIRRTMAGINLGTTCGWLTDNGVPTPFNKRGWGRETLVGLLTNPRLCGWRATSKVIVYDEQGEPVRGLWEPLMSPEEWLALQAFVAPKGSKNPGQRSDKKYLYSGILRCGRLHPDGAICLSRMGGMPGTSVKRPNTKPRYGCGARGKGGCGGLSVTVPDVDRILTELVLRIVETREAKATTTGQSWPKTERLATLRRQQGELTATYKSGDWEGPVSVYVDSQNGLATQITKLEAERIEWLGIHAPMAVDEDGTDGTDVRSRWRDMTFEQKCSLVSRVLDHVIVLPAANNGSRTFDENRLQPVLRESVKSS